eukprot:TRINITY_DN11019_c0_g1_i1.p1 TRINITY_DN11019_c0_g1~~TRINITY_DN11019_c0_g1_i1.p1  ORF type:complete len:540 (+),score=95.47 TRINITY_DN11019_c0_g1_i1:73-1692(+)
MADEWRSDDSSAASFPAQGKLEEEESSSLSSVEEKKRKWIEELKEFNGILDAGVKIVDGDHGDSFPSATPTVHFEDEGGKEVESEGLVEQMKGFVKSSAELLENLVDACVDVLRQSYLGHFQNSVFAKRIALLSQKISPHLELFLPEAKSPAHVFAVFFFVSLLTVTVLRIGMSKEDLPAKSSEVLSLAITAERIQLPDGRYVAYREEGMPASLAKHSMLVIHSFLSSRLAGIPGVKKSLLEEFGVRLVMYDLPGFGESDPHPQRNLTSSAYDIQYIADTLQLGEQFWVLGHSSGGLHVWAAIRYIPERLAGAALLAPMGNPYDPHMSKDEIRKIWEHWSFWRKLGFILAKRAASFLPSFYKRNYLTSVENLVRAQSFTLGKKDAALVELDFFIDFERRDMLESLRQGSITPLVQETLLQVNDWGFNLAELRVRKKNMIGFTSWFNNLFTPSEEEWEGFRGPIHIWQGTDDRIVPYHFNSYAKRAIPGIILHKLNGEGHFSYFFFCDKCHREILLDLFGNPEIIVDQNCTGVPSGNAVL